MFIVAKQCELMLIKCAATAIGSTTEKETMAGGYMR